MMDRTRKIRLISNSFYNAGLERAKNGILIVEFANQKQESGENKMQAIRDAALQRLRPILMTSASI